ncbi:hypothetical protein [Porphyromonas sp. COT-108 OH1349]|uniref:hypothetical protein n=1 Tax=Porphyromonas sp. COT-108 OH1349 TaxID=1537504 RepID=UPI00068F99EB|nr:hypothetical protein [Porphyromonas sp. COT-108 OH1349]
MNIKEFLKRPWLISAALILLMAGIAFLYFFPANVEGRILFQMDGLGASGMAQDVREYRQETGENSLWTESAFGGMPMYQISPTYPSASNLKTIGDLYKLKKPFDLMPGDSYLLFAMLLGFYIFMRAWGVKRLSSFAGAVMWTFSSYFIILIDAGHIWKLLALMYIPPTIAGLVLLYKRKKWLLGTFVTALFSALQIYSNHIQMSYYFGFLMLALVIGWAVEAYRSKAWKPFLLATLLAFVGGLIGVATNATNLYHTYKYSKETMRGGSELTPKADDEQVHTTTAGGLDKAYITQWSYGIDEMLTFLIPDAKGGYSTQIGTSNRDMLSEVQEPYRPFVAQQNRYWGDQPFTAGPVYVGAVVLFLFFLGLLIVKGPVKWAVAGATLLTVMLSWGHNMMWLTDIFIDYFPMYNKFRTPSSILVVSEFTIPFLAILGLTKWMQTPKALKTYKNEYIIAAALTGGVALIFALFPGLYGGFLSDEEQRILAPYMAQSQEFQIAVGELRNIREALFTADAWRAVIFSLLAMSVLVASAYGKLNKTLTVAAVTILAIVDLWSVDKRYLNDEKYHDANRLMEQTYAKTEADKYILQDTTDYRVMNLAVNTFNDATTSYHHNSVGGYHAAKLQRYQDLIESYLSKMDRNILRALNTKYYILPDSLRGLSVVEDSLAYGNGWFISSIKEVKGADEEFKAIGENNLREVAVIEQTYLQDLKGKKSFETDSTATISLVSKLPNRKVYRTSNKADGLAVFSEIFYKDGWNVTIDGETAKLLRTNYILRALPIPAGEHTIEMWFDPASVHTTERIASVAGWIILLLMVATIGFAGSKYIRRRKSE